MITIIFLHAVHVIQLIVLIFIHNYRVQMHGTNLNSIIQIHILCVRMWSRFHMVAFNTIFE